MTEHVSPWRKPERAVTARQRVLGDFVIDREIGRGGMGVVWLATQSSLGRRVALKVLPNFASMDVDAVMRFRREAEATGRLAHPGIVPVYGVGEVDGIPYFAMEFIDGPPLGAILEALSMRQADRLRGAFVEEAQIAERYPAMREPPATGAGNRYVRSCARLCADVANALGAAHRQGVIHRDVKPNNILIHPAGRPVLVDFGLARDERATALTKSGEQIGTPAYMAPEQARGHRSVDARTDVYGLGAVLYEMLTLRPPFEGRTPAEIQHRILSEDPVPVRRHNPTVPVDLAAIVHRCLRKSPDERYPAIEATEMDLRNFLAGRPVTAQLPSWWVQVHGALQRHRRSLTISSTAALAALGIAVSIGVVDDRADKRTGHRLLAEAGEALVERLDVDRARDLYSRAMALTKDPAAVWTQRCRDFRSAFERHYTSESDRATAVLVRFAAVLEEQERREVQDVLDRLDGRGWIQFDSKAIAMQTAMLEQRRITENGLGDWEPLEVGQLLPTGERLVRATSVDGVEALVCTEITADTGVEIAPRYLGPDELPARHAAVVDPLSRETIAVSHLEVTREEWRDWLQSITDLDVRRAMQPEDWDGGFDRLDEPVRGLSFNQARAYAAANGAHLPTNRELWLAGSAGLAQLRYPWGSEFDESLIAADPFRLSGPLPVLAPEASQSPLRVSHVLGNVAEFLSASGGGLPRIAGGSFLDDASELSLLPDGTVPTQALADVYTPHPGAGLRLFRFVAGVDDEIRQAASIDRRADLHDQNGSILTEWTLERDGTLRCVYEIGQLFDGGDRRRTWMLDTPGFVQLPGTVQALDGHRKSLDAPTATSRNGETSQLFGEIGEVVKEGQLHHATLRAQLMPVGGLLPQRDAYVLRLPMQRGLVGRLHLLTLPADCRIMEVSPQALQWTYDGKPRLMWEPTPTTMIETAVVRFRIDGSLGTSLTNPVRAVERTSRLLRALSDRASSVEDMLDRRFVRHPGETDRDDTVRGRGRERFDNVVVVDSVRIGDVETTELVVDWTLRGKSGEALRLQRIPMIVQWHHDGANARAIRFQPRTMTDLGRYAGEGGYEHHGMQMRIEPITRTSLSRTQEELCELQVLLLPEQLEMRAQVLGHFAKGERAEAVQFRLTKGDSVLRGGELIGSRTQGGYVIQDWVFGLDGRFVAERWIFQQYGTRHLFYRFASTVLSDRRAEAARQLSVPEVEDWIDQVLGAVRPM